MPIAKSIEIYANSQRTKPPYSKLTDFCFYLAEEERTRIDARLCDTFFSLTRDETLPSWAIHLFPVAEMRRWKADGAPGNPRLWMRQGLALVMPQIDNGVLLAGALCYDSEIAIAPGLTAVWDADTGEEIIIFIPESPPLPEFDLEIVWEQIKTL